MSDTTQEPAITKESLNEAAAAFLTGKSVGNPEAQDFKTEQTTEPAEETMEDSGNSPEEEVVDETDDVESDDNDTDEEGSESDESDDNLQDAIKQTERKLKKKYLSQVSKKDKQVKQLEAKLAQLREWYDSDELEVIDSMVEKKIAERDRLIQEKREETMFFNKNPDAQKFKEDLKDLKNKSPELSWDFIYKWYTWMNSEKTPKAAPQNKSVTGWLPAWAVEDRPQDMSLEQLKEKLRGSDELKAFSGQY